MTRIITLLLLLLTSDHLADESFTMVSYNIRQDTAGDKGPRDWQQRKDMLTGYLLKSQASIIGRAN